MDEDVGQALRRIRAGISRRRQAATALLAEWRSDPEWRPDCNACGRPGGILTVLRPGEHEQVQERLQVRCPWRDDPERCNLAAADRASAAEAKARWLREHGVGRRYQGMRLEMVPQGVRREIGAYLTCLREHVASGRGLLLAGPVGAGKTAVLGLIAERAFDLEITAELVHCSALFAAFYRRGRDDGDRLQRWRGSALLLLDDFGVPYAHDFPLAEFEAFVEHRHAEMLATCVTTNARIEDLRADAAWARVYDRWRATCWGYVLDGPSQRAPLEGTP